MLVAVILCMNALATLLNVFSAAAASAPMDILSDSTAPHTAELNLKKTATGLHCFAVSVTGHTLVSMERANYYHVAE